MKLSYAMMLHVNTASFRDCVSCEFDRRMASGNTAVKF